MANANLLSTVTMSCFNDMVSKAFVDKAYSMSNERYPTKDAPNWENRFMLFVLFGVIPALLIVIL